MDYFLIWLITMLSVNVIIGGYFILKKRRTGSDRYNQSITVSVVFSMIWFVFLCTTLYLDHILL